MSTLPTLPISTSEVKATSKPSSSTKVVDAKNSNQFAAVLDKATHHKDAPTRDVNSGKSTKNKDAAKPSSVDKTDKAEPRTDETKVSTNKDADETTGAQSKDANDATDGEPTGKTDVASKEATGNGEGSPLTPEAPSVMPVVTLPVVDPAAIAQPAVAAVVPTVSPVVPAVTDGTQDAGIAAAITAMPAPTSSPINQVVDPAKMTVSPDLPLINDVVTSVQVDTEVNIAPAITEALMEPTVDPSFTKLVDVASSTQMPSPVALDTAVVETVNKAALEMMGNTQNPQTAATSTVSNVAPTASSTTSADALVEPYKQVVDIITPLRHRGDGDYTMTLQLHPEHLGRVEIAVTLTAGQINMQLSSDNPASRQMLKDAMNELRQSLQSSGLETGSLDVSTGFAGNRGDNADNAARNGRNGGLSADYVMENDSFFSRLGNTSAQSVNADGAFDVRI